MKVQSYRRVEDLPPSALEFLAQDDFQNNVPYGILRMMQQNPANFSDYEISLVTDHAAVKLYAQHTPPYQPYLSLGEVSAVRALVRAWKSEGKSLPGLLGPLAVTEAFLEGWPELRQQWSRIERQGLYRLEQVERQPETGALFETARMEDCDLYCEWLKAFCVELNDPFPGDEKARAIQKSRIEAGDLHCLSIDGEPQCMAVAGRKTIQGRFVAFVYTPQEKRGKGLAADLVARLSQKILDEGASYCGLFTQLDNPISNRIYQRMGYQLVSEYRKYW